MTQDIVRGGSQPSLLALPPSQSLPDDVLVKIFAELRDDRSDVGYVNRYKYRATAERVCRQWCRVLREVLDFV